MRYETDRVLKAIASERERQIKVLGFDSTHDDAYVCDELAKAAACYANPVKLHLIATSDIANTGDVPGPGLDLTGLPVGWPDTWDAKWWRRRETRREELVIAAALLVAEIERIDRAAARQVDLYALAAKGGGYTLAEMRNHLAGVEARERVTAKHPALGMPYNFSTIDPKGSEPGALDHIPPEQDWE